MENSRILSEPWTISYETNKLGLLGREDSLASMLKTAIQSQPQ